MINNYKVKKVNNEEILYIYINLDNEFAKENLKDKKQKLDKIIKEYLKQNKINFKGTKVAIIAGGMLIGTIALKAPNTKKTTVANIDNYVVSLIDENILDNEIELMKEVEEDNNKEQKVISKEVVKEEKTESEKNSSMSKNNNTNNHPKSKSSTVSSQTTKTETNNTKEEVKEVKDNKVYVTIKRSSGLITNIELEEYLIGVVGAEMPASFDEEALKAQAIIARTYAINTLNKGKILTDNSSTQNYKDNSELKKMWSSSYNTYYQKVKNAVSKTEGIYLTYNGQIIDAVYHSTSNGQTEDAKYVWGNSKPYLVSVESPYDTNNKSFSYDKFMAYEELSKILKTEINQDTEINILSYTTGKRVEKIEIADKIYTGVEIRTLLTLRSADFEITKEDNGINFKTKGYGHGVGLSQYGANGMAKAGYNYEQILKHYYKGVKLTKI